MPDPEKKVLSQEKIQSFALKKLRSLRVPASVYRLQFNQYFTFKHAKTLISYFKELGIEMLYCSPYFQSVPGSLHGYNITDSNKINPEIGSEDDYQQFCDALKNHGMGQIVDVVPNHMGVTGNNNHWWQDVLENGPSSIFARFFDIDWEPVKTELSRKVLIPILGDLYGHLLENQEIVLAFQKGAFEIRYHEHLLPVDPTTYPVILEQNLEDLKRAARPDDEELLEFLSVMTAFKNLPPTTTQDFQLMLERHREKEIAKKRLEALTERSERIRNYIRDSVKLFNGAPKDTKSFDLLDALLGAQSYRMTYWRVAAEEINYRRFFNVNELAAIRIEDDGVFEKYHELLFKLLRENKVQGLRVDHPDGLYNPPSYFQKLQTEYLAQCLYEEAGLNSGSPSHADPAERLRIQQILQNTLDGTAAPEALYVVAEKILDRNEKLPGNWKIHGTVGYDYLNALNALFIDRRSVKDFERIYERIIGRTIDFDELVYNRKKFFALVHMASEINALGHRLDLISERNRNYRDFTRNNITLAIREVIACFPVYRTYISGEGKAVSERDEKYIRLAVEIAKSKTPALNPAVYHFLRDVLLLKLDPEVRAEDQMLYRDFVLRFQQLTGPIMAKGLEDTAFYVYNRFIALNEVGGDPFYFGYARTDFHRQNEDRNKRWPYSMITSTTHDTKRSADVRARLCVLSEMPNEWSQRTAEWIRLNKDKKSDVDGRPEPDPNTEYFIYQTLVGVWQDEPVPDGEYPALIHRLWECFLKSVRESKTYTSWAQPNEAYEEAARRFVEGILDPNPKNPFLKDFLPFQKRIAFYGMLNALSALVLKIGSPGVIDTYQGDELWNYVLVDPDNRRSVDYQKRVKLLKSLKEEDGRQDRTGKHLAGYLKNWRDGRIKLYLLWKGLQLRNRCRDLFLGGEYIPLEIRGEKEQNLVAFMRKKGNRVALVAAGRFFTELHAVPEKIDSGLSVWKDTTILLPKFAASCGALKDVFSGRVWKSAPERGFRASELFGPLDAVILTNEESY